MSDINLYIAHGERPLYLNARMANRHGLIAGATGTGKTVTLQVMAEAFSAQGVPVFMADVKGDLSGIAKPGVANKVIDARKQEFGLNDFRFQGFPVCFYDVFGKQGHPLRTTVSEIGPLLLSRLLNLNDTQSGTLQLIFRIADDNGWLLLDMKDLRAMLDYASKNAKQFTSYGNIAAVSVGAIQRNLLTLENQGGNIFLGEPAFDIYDLLRTDEGKGIISILASDKLMQSPVLYSTMLLWLLSELYETLPEAGDLPKPKLVFFFDEAHLLFDNAPKILTDKIEQIARLIRSKGVGVYFISQSPSDIPDDILGQLGNRVQHALRAFTPRDQKAVKTAAETFRPNPALDTAKVITELGVGEALVSFLDEKGSPTMVERAKILPPQSQIGPLTEDERTKLIRSSNVYGKYENAIDRESAYEELQEKAKADARAQEADQRTREAEKQARTASRQSYAPRQRDYAPRTTYTRSSTRRSSGSSVGASIARSFATAIGRQLVRGILGSFTK